VANRRTRRHGAVEDGWAIEDPAHANAGAASAPSSDGGTESSVPSQSARRRVSPNVIRRPTFSGMPASDFEHAHATMIRERLASPSNKMIVAEPAELDQAAPHINATAHLISEEVSQDERLFMLSASDGEEAAAYRILRHRLIGLGSPQVIVVSSPREDEKKSICAANLAFALGEYRRARVLLVEADFSKPALAQMLGFEPTGCFAEQLLEHKDKPYLGWNIDTLQPTGVQVMALSGERDSTLLDAPAFSAAMRQLRASGYDHIVVDAPPVLGSAEVNVVQDAADGVVLSTRRGKTKGKELRECAGQLIPGSILGMVLHED